MLIRKEEKRKRTDMPEGRNGHRDQSSHQDALVLDTIVNICLQERKIMIRKRKRKRVWKQTVEHPVLSSHVPVLDGATEVIRDLNTDPVHTAAAVPLGFSSGGVEATVAHSA